MHTYYVLLKQLGNMNIKSYSRNWVGISVSIDSHKILRTYSEDDDNDNDELRSMLYIVHHTVQQTFSPFFLNYIYYYLYKRTPQPIYLYSTQWSILENAMARYTPSRGITLIDVPQHSDTHTSATARVFHENTTHEYIHSRKNQSCFMQTYTMCMERRKQEDFFFLKRLTLFIWDESPGSCWFWMQRRFEVGSAERLLLYVPAIFSSYFCYFLFVFKNVALRLCVDFSLCFVFHCHRR